MMIHKDGVADPGSDRDRTGRQDRPAGMSRSTDPCNFGSLPCRHGLGGVVITKPVDLVLGRAWRAVSWIKTLCAILKRAASCSQPLAIGTTTVLLR